MNKNLPQIVAGLFATAKSGEDLSTRVLSLHAEIQKVIEGEDSIYGKFHGLLESFREIIPDEKQRYQAALKALSTTSKLGRQEIVKAISDQLEELKIIDKGLTPAVPGWREEMKAMEARAQGTKGEIAKLREIIARLENEEKIVLAGMAAREKEMELVEKTMRELFTAAGAEMTAVMKKMEGLPAEGPVQTAPLPGKAAPAVQPVPPSGPAKTDAPVEKKEEAGQGSEAPAPPAPAPLDPKFQRKCPHCGGVLNLHELDKVWICYTCAYEEPIQGEVQGTDAGQHTVGFSGELTEEPAPSPAQEPIFPEPSPSIAVPVAEMTYDDYKQQKKRSAAPAPGSRAPIKKKTCPVCTKKMLWHPDENVWRCPNCDYERRI